MHIRSLASFGGLVISFAWFSIAAPDAVKDIVFDDPACDTTTFENLKVMVRWTVSKH